MHLIEILGRFEKDPIGAGFDGLMGTVDGLVQTMDAERVVMATLSCCYVLR